MNKIFKTTIRCTKEAKESLEKAFGTFYFGASTAANVYPKIRVLALKAVQQEVTPKEFEIIEKLSSNDYLKDHFMLDPVIMIRALSMKQDEINLNIDWQAISYKIGDINPIHMYFLFTEVKRFREIKKDVPTYDAREFFRYEMM